MDLSIDAIDDEVMTIAMFVGKSAVDDASDDRLAQLIMDSAVDACTFEFPGG